MYYLFVFVKTIQRVALDLNTTHTLNVIMTQHHRESMPVFEIVYQTLRLYFRTSLLVLVPIRRDGFAEMPITLDGSI